MPSLTGDTKTIISDWMDRLRLDMNQAQYQYSLAMQLPWSSQPYGVFRDQQTATSSDSDWVEAIYQASLSSSSGSYSVVSMPAPAGRLQPLSFDQIIHGHTAQRGTSVESNNDSIQQNDRSAGEDTLFANPIEKALVLDPGGLQLRQVFFGDMTGLIFGMGGFERTEMHAQGFQTDRPTHSYLPNVQYTPEIFEQEFPYSQASSSRQPDPTTSALDEAYMCKRRDHLLQLQSMSDVPKPSPNALTKIKQADRVLVFHSSTGKPHKPASKKPRRKETEAQRHHRKSIRHRGGQCGSCKGRKRRCDLSHSVSRSHVRTESTSRSEVSYSGINRSRNNLVS